MHLFHKWSKWNELDNGAILRKKNEGEKSKKERIVGFYISQEKVCTVCGKKVRDMQTSYIAY